MKKEELFEVIGEINEDQVRAARGVAPQKRKWVAAAAACLVLVAVMGFVAFWNSQNTIALSNASQGVTVKYVTNAPTLHRNADLIALTEEELFTRFDTAIFRGTVTKIDNIVLNFNGSKSYQAIAQIQVEKVYRGDCQTGDTVSVLLTCPIADGVWVEDSGTVAAMRVGMTGIFMPMVYDETSYWKENGATLILKDVASYGFADGSRYAFLEMEDGLIFDRWAYESIADAATLEEIEEYILKMLSTIE